MQAFFAAALKKAASHKGAISGRLRGREQTHKMFLEKRCKKVKKGVDKGRRSWYNN